MNLDIIKNEISNPAMRELAGAILGTVEEIKSGKKNYNQGLAELNGYKQVLQIIALEIMRNRIPTTALGFKS